MYACNFLNWSGQEYGRWTDPQSLASLSSGTSILNKPSMLNAFLGNLKTKIKNCSVLEVSKCRKIIMILYSERKYSL